MSSNNSLLIRLLKSWHMPWLPSVTSWTPATTLSNANNTKILELEDELSTQLHDLVAGREDIETTAFSDDEVLALGVCVFPCWQVQRHGPKKTKVASKMVQGTPLVSLLRRKIRV